MGHFSLFKMKISILKMVTNWLLTFWFMNAFTWLTWKFLAVFCLVLKLFQVRLHIHPDTGQILPCCFHFNWMVIVECYLARHCFVNWSSQLEALIVKEQLSSFYPCHYLLPLIQIVNKLITNDEMRDTNSEMRAKPHKALWNQQRSKRWIEHRFRIVK